MNSSLIAPNSQQKPSKANSCPRFLPISKLKKTLAYIKENLEAEICLNALAREVGISIFYFSRMFKNSIGKSPHQFIIEQRIDYAKWLLKNSDEPLNQIALRCGWSNQSNFSTAFKRIVGVTPKFYRFQS